MDRAWWARYLPDVKAQFTGARISQLDALKDVHKVTLATPPNSGAAAIALAAHWGAKRVILLGYDCQKTGGQAHWHGDHPAALGNAGSVGKWPAQFRKLADSLRGTEIINCSRQTALDMFPRQSLEEVLT